MPAAPQRTALAPNASPAAPPPVLRGPSNIPALAARCVETARHAPKPSAPRGRADTTAPEGVHPVTGAQVTLMLPDSALHEQGSVLAELQCVQLVPPMASKPSCQAAQSEGTKN